MCLIGVRQEVAQNVGHIINYLTPFSYSHYSHVCSNSGGGGGGGGGGQPHEKMRK